MLNSIIHRFDNDNNQQDDDDNDAIRIRYINKQKIIQKEIERNNKLDERIHKLKEIKNNKLILNFKYGNPPQN